MHRDCYTQLSSQSPPYICSNLHAHLLKRVRICWEWLDAKNISQKVVSGLSLNCIWRLGFSSGNVDSRNNPFITIINWSVLTRSVSDCLSSMHVPDRDADELFIADRNIWNCITGFKILESGRKILSTSCISCVSDITGYVPVSYSKQNADTSSAKVPCKFHEWPARQDAQRVGGRGDHAWVSGKLYKQRNILTQAEESKKAKTFLIEKRAITSVWVWISATSDCHFSTNTFTSGNKRKKKKKKNQIIFLDIGVVFVWCIQHKTVKISNKNINVNL